MKRILLAEDKPIVVKAMQILLETEFREYGLAISGSQDMLKKSLQNQQYALVIIGVGIGGGNIIQLLTSLRALYPNLQIVIFSPFPDESYANHFLQKGINGYLSYDTPDEEIVHALKTIIEGNSYFAKNSKHRSYNNKTVPAPVR